MSNRLAKVSSNIVVAAVFVSLILHTFGVVLLDRASLRKKTEPDNAIKIRLIEKKEDVKIEKPPKPLLLPEKPKPKPKPKPKLKQIATERPKKQDTPPAEPPKPVMGLDKDSFASSGKSSVSVPMGNTLMMEDDGTRVNTPPPAMDVDLSSDAQLIRQSFVIPQYSEAALDAGFEGFVFVDVQVNEMGSVVDAEIRKIVGYGMDPKILAAVMEAKFIPRKNRLGRAEAGWTEIKFTLQIP